MFTATGCTGDPHFRISSSDADNTHLCFDVDGQDALDGDVLVLLQDSKLGRLDSVPLIKKKGFSNRRHLKH